MAGCTFPRTRPGCPLDLPARLMEAQVDAAVCCLPQHATVSRERSPQLGGARVFGRLGGTRCGQPLGEGYVGIGATTAVASVALRCRWRAAPGRRRCWKRSRSVRVPAAAIVEGDGHACAVQTWVDEFVIGLGFCPWAGPAASSGHVRVVTTTASSEEGVLADLAAEARGLPAGQEIEHGTPTTTLLVCPYVEDWLDYSEFNRFYEHELSGGYAFAELSLYVVPFHPAFVEGPAKPAVTLSEGEVLDMGEAEPGGAMLRAAVVEPLCGYGESGQPLAKVRFLPDAAAGIEGEERIIVLPSLPAGSAESTVAHAASRAPRPTLHLLRVPDLDRADDDGSLRVSNRRQADAIGPKGLRELLRRCG